ncbi:hypothetical protein KQX54_016381 [Cotesia glomerata]|uniref:Uncharacterized protein n=1 Tax=Cotesia glomerata TaxID=32391 RepID=A0AAV7IMI9_COTGL|nr:hypothetical protein KQX54_016381 [Cotesia glomerata]
MGENATYDVEMEQLGREPFPRTGTQKSPGPGVKRPPLSNISNKQKQKKVPRQIKSNERTVGPMAQLVRLERSVNVLGLKINKALKKNKSERPQQENVVYPNLDESVIFENNVEFTIIDGVRIDSENFANMVITKTMRKRADTLVHEIWPPGVMKNMYLRLPKNPKPDDIIVNSADKRKVRNGIKKLLIDKEINYKRLKTSAGLPKRHEPKYAIDLINYINYWSNVMKKEKERFNVREFLFMKPKCLNELLHSLKVLIGDDFNKMTVNDVAPNLLDRKLSIVKHLIRQLTDVLKKKKQANSTVTSQMRLFKNPRLPTSTVTSQIRLFNNPKPSTSTVTSQMDFSNAAATPPTSTVTYQTRLFNNPKPSTSSVTSQLDFFKAVRSPTPTVVTSQKDFSNTPTLPTTTVTCKTDIFLKSIKLSQINSSDTSSLKEVTINGKVAHLIPVNYLKVGSLKILKDSTNCIR